MPGRYEKDSPPTKEDFTEHVKDTETGLHYAGARYYSAAFGVWNAVDPLAGDRPGWDPYAYAVGNPVNLMDPNGMEPCPYDKSQECGIILPEVVVTAEEPEETADAGVVGGTFYFNSSTREGRQALRDRLQQNPSAARRMLAQRATQRFTPTARKIAFEENIYAGQRQALQIALQTGADLATVASLLSGAGSAVGIGGLLLERGGVSIGRQGAVSLLRTSSKAGLYASGTESALRISAVPVGGSKSAAGQAVAMSAVSALPSVPAVRGVNPTGMTGPAFRDIASGQFVTNSYGIGRYSFVQGIEATPGLTTGFLIIDDN
jgi:RHS repeat-associated protein